MLQLNRKVAGSEKPASVFASGLLMACRVADGVVNSVLVILRWK